MENTEKTAQDWAMGDIMSLSDLAIETVRNVSKNANNVPHLLVMGKTIEAVKRSIEVEYLCEKTLLILRQMGKRSEKAHFTGFQGSTLENLNYSDFLIPSDFWEQEDNKNKLQHFTKLILTNGKLQNQ